MTEAVRAGEIAREVLRMMAETGRLDKCAEYHEIEGWTVTLARALLAAEGVIAAARELPDDIAALNAIHGGSQVALMGRLTITTRLGERGRKLRSALTTYDQHHGRP